VARGRDDDRIEMQTDEEIRRRLERQVTDQVLDQLMLGASPRVVIDALVADGFDRAAASAFVRPVPHSPEDKATRRFARPWAWAAVFLAGFLAGLVAALGVIGAACSRFWHG
jgi:hypothetical protein